MSNTPSQVVSPELITAWLDRFRNLQSLIQSEPSGDWSWLWRVRRDILYYLLRRYGAEVTARDLLTSPIVQPNAPRIPQESTSAYLHPTTGDEIKEDSLHPPRTQANFRDRLGHVHEVNEQVHREALDPRRRITRLTYPETGFQPPNEQLVDPQRVIVESDLESIREVIGENDDPEIAHRSLTDDEIVAILCDKAC